MTLTDLHAGVPPSGPIFVSGPTGQSVPLMVAGDGGLVLAAFSCMKLLPAQEILRSARERGELEPGATVIATSSGTFAYALAHECAQLGHPCVVVSDPAIDPRFGSLLTNVEARVEIVPAPAAVGGYQQARLDLVDEIHAQIPGSFVADQYGDPGNADSYAPVAELLHRAVGPIDAIVGTVGSGGSMGGLGRTLRQVSNGDVMVVGVDTPGSVVFGCDDAPRLLRGLGNSLIPGNVDHTVFDHVHWVDATTAFSATIGLYRDHGLLQGPTSGAAYAVAQQYAATSPDARVVAILPDAGWRYLDTVYNGAWLAEAVGDAAPATQPVQVRDPRAVPDAGWSWMRWDRRTREDVLAQEVAR